MANGSETTVPRFGSFKPRNHSAKGNKSPNNSNGKERELKLGNHRIEKPKPNRASRHANRGDSYRPRTERSISPHSRDRADRHRDWSANRDIQVIGTQLRGASLSRQEHQPFFADSRGDSGNLLYGKSNKWSLSSYHLYGGGSILGLDPDIKIDRKLSDHNSYTLMYPRNKQPMKIIDPLDFDVPFEHARADDHGADTASSDQLQSAEMDFVPLPFSQNRNDGK
jgi:hypothetical protein